MIPVSVSDEVDALLAAHAPVAVGVSGGKDSQAAALAVAAHLRRIGHRGPTLLVFSDLGRVDWQQSLPVCETLAVHLGWELLVVRRRAGDLLHRWQSRWESSLRRYGELTCAKVILPWSTAKLRYCTGEMKTDVIASALRKRFPTGPIVSATGIRAEESRQRSRKPVSRPNVKLARKRGDSQGLDWNPILTATKDQVLATIAEEGLQLHQAYVEYGTSRVSCRFCIMSSIGDLTAAAAAEESHDLYLEMCALEISSSFSFQPGRWLSTVRPSLLGPDAVDRIEASMKRAHSRDLIEARVPQSMLFSSKGWPTGAPSLTDAAALASVRTEIAALYELEIGYVTATDVRDRLQELFEVGLRRTEEKANIALRRQLRSASALA